MVLFNPMFGNTALKKAFIHVIGRVSLGADLMQVSRSCYWTMDRHQSVSFITHGYYLYHKPIAVLLQVNTFKQPHTSVS
jgi:hypothetical protein